LWASRQGGVAVGTALVCLLAGCSGRRGPSYAEARAAVDRHCVGCHSDRPTVPAFPIAPGGIELDTAEQMQRHADRIKVRAFIERNMPLLNKTGIADTERELLGRWVDAGAFGP
jgi:uncharacterized membrane protein